MVLPEATQLDRKNVVQECEEAKYTYLGIEETEGTEIIK